MDVNKRCGCLNVVESSGCKNGCLNVAIKMWMPRCGGVEWMREWMRTKMNSKWM